MLVLGLTTGLLFLFRTNASVHEDQQLQRVIGNMSESIKALEYVSCDGVGVGEVTPPVGPGSPTQDSTKLVQRYTQRLSDGAAAVVETAGTSPSGQSLYRPTADWRPVDGVTVEIVRVEFWQKVTFGAASTTTSTVSTTSTSSTVPVTASPAPGAGSFRADCPFERTTSGAVVLTNGAPVVIDDGAQLLTLRVRLGDRTATAQVIKADRRPVVSAVGP